MEDKRNLLVDSFPSSFVFIVIFSLLYVVTFFVMRGLAGAVGIDNIMSLRFILMFITLYGLCAGVIMGAFQRKLSFVFVGCVSGPVGTWLNWGALTMLAIWGTCYGLVLGVVSLIKMDTPVWTVMNAKAEMADGLAKSSGLIFALALVVGILLLVAYTRLQFDTVYPVYSSLKLPLGIFLSVVIVAGLAFSVLSPRMTQREFVEKSFNSMPERVNMAAVQGVTTAIGVHLVKYGGSEIVKKSSDSEIENANGPHKKKPDIPFGDYTIIINDGNVSIARGIKKTRANVAVYLESWMQIVRGEQTISAAIDNGQASFTGSEEVVKAADPYFMAFQPSLNPTFNIMLAIVVILFLGSFSIAPMLCAYDAFHYWSHELVVEADE